MIGLTLLAIIVIFVIILFVKKKRFSKKFKPNLIFKMGGLADGMGWLPVKKNLIPIFFTKHPLNVLKPEEARVLVKLPPLGIGIVAITLKVRAEDSSHVIITNLNDLNLVIPTAILDGVPIATLVAKGSTYTINIFASSLKIFGIAKSIEVRFS